MVERESARFAAGERFERDFADLPVAGSAAIHGIQNEDLLRHLLAEAECEEHLAYAGSDVHRMHVLRQLVVISEVRQGLRTEPVITEQDVAHAEKQHTRSAVGGQRVR